MFGLELQTKCMNYYFCICYLKSMWKCHQELSFISPRCPVFSCSPLPKMPRQPAAGASLRGRAVQVRQEDLRGEVVHPAGSGERWAGTLHWDADPPWRSHAHPHLPPALEQSRRHGPRLARRPAHLPQAAHRVPGLLPGSGCSQWEGVGGATATAGFRFRQQSQGSYKRSPVHHRRGSARTRREFWLLMLMNAHLCQFSYFSLTSLNVALWWTLKATVEGLWKCFLKRLDLFWW